MKLIYSFPLVCILTSAWMVAIINKDCIAAIAILPLIVITLNEQIRDNWE